MNEVSTTNYDFCGWATKNDLKCSDGRVIRHGAFQSSNGRIVPLVYQHNHDNVTNVVGKVLLENRNEGVYGYGLFNATSSGAHAKEAVIHGDITAMSIWANNVQQIGQDVVHGVIREVSLVLAGANPMAFIESTVSHGMAMEDGDDECILYTGDYLILEGGKLSHAEPEEDKQKEESKEDEDGESVKDVIEGMSDKQKQAVALLVGQIIRKDKEKSKEEKEKEDDSLKHNIFEGPDKTENVISHDDLKELLRNGKRLGSLRAAIRENIESGGFLSHGVPTTGMETSTGNSSYGINDASMLFPDFKSYTTGAPELISRNQDWVVKWMSGVHKTPFSRVRSVFADITEDEARAKGYIKGNQKKEEVFTILKRKTEPQTIYKLQKMDRDDVLDITEFDVITWLRAEMRLMLEEEAARAMIIGDGRPGDAEDKIKTDNIRPCITDVPLFNKQVIIKVSPTATENEIAKATIRAVIKSRKSYKGSGNPTFWTTDDVITDMLLIENQIGERVYKTEAELATTLRAKEIVPVEPMAGETVTVNGKSLEVLGVLVNPIDYNVGADKGGEITNMEDFDIDFNRMVYLIETRFSGALVKPFSAITFLLEKTTETGTSTSSYSSREK